MIHHLAHLNKFSAFVKKGTKIRRGDIIGEVGNTGTRYAHLHYEVHKQKPSSWNGYNNGWSKEQTLAHYADPNEWIDKRANIPARYTSTAGWEFMDVRNRRGDTHPAVDINDGYGNQDLGNPVRSPVDGTVVYIGRDISGWGNHLFIEEEEKGLDNFDMEFALKLAGRFFLQVEEHGEAWYITPKGQRVYIGNTPAEMLAFVEAHAEGISNNDLNKIPEQK